MNDYLYKRGQAIYSTGQSSLLWRIRSGVVRLDQGHDTDDQQLVALAVPGDLLGTEALCGTPYQMQAQALTDVFLQPIEIKDEAQRQRLMMQTILQQPERSHDMARLRTGPVLARVAQLLRMLGHTSLTATRPVLPTLRELAHVVDAKPETVCRALAQLLPARSRKQEPSQPFTACLAVA